MDINKQSPKYMEALRSLPEDHPKAVQALMRHSSITLTMDTYGHLFPGQEAETVARFPSMMGEQPQELRATGTCNVGPVMSASAQQYPQQ